MVPLERYASLASSGAAITAAAVSCVGARRIWVSKPTAWAISGSSAPTRVPGCDRGPNSRRGKPQRSISSQSQSRARASSSPVVEALVYSCTRWPVSR